MSELIIKGIVKSALETQTGEGKSGTWRKRTVIIETEGKFPKSVAVDVWGDNIDKFPIEKDKTVDVSLDIESREFNGKWYTNVKAWKMTAAEGITEPKQEVAPVAEVVDGSDLPF